MARIYQDPKERARLVAEGKNPDKAAWYVCIKRGRKSIARKIGRKKDAEAVAAQWESEKRLRRAGVTTDKSWKLFREEFRDHGMNDMLATGSVTEMERSLDHLERIVEPRLVSDVDRMALDRFVKARLGERGRNPSDKLSRHTVKKDMRHIKAALNRAREWNYLTIVPVFPKVKAEESDPDFVLMAHFQAMLDKVSIMQFPRQHPDPPAWWRGFLWTLYASGSRVGAILAARWEWLHLAETEEGVLATIAFPAGKVKQKKSYAPKITAALSYLQPLMPEELRGLIFPWAPHDRRTLDVEFRKLQVAAGIYLPCPKEGHDQHVCLPTCHVYGWHALRYAHGTYNYGRVTDLDLMRQMGHSTRAMMDRYARLARRNAGTMYNLYLPGAEKAANGAGNGVSLEATKTAPREKVGE